MGYYSCLLVISGTLIITACGSEHAPSQEDLGNACLEATRNAIQIEIKRFEGWINKSPDVQFASHARKRLPKLLEDKLKYDSMNIADYVLPNEILLNGRYSGDQIHFEGQTRSGPFYHVVDSITTLKDGDTGSFRCYILYPRWYSDMSGNYVYVFEHR